VSTGDADQISEIVDELRRELESLKPAASAPRDVTELIREMRAASSIGMEQGMLLCPGPLAPLRRLVKRAIRKAVRWYVEPVAVDAREFAAASLRVSEALDDRTKALQGIDLQQAERRLEEIERHLAAVRDRVGRLERASRAAPPAPGAASSPPAPSDRGGAARALPAFDYFAFEALMRGSREEIAERQRRYVAEFTEVDDILDAGCGRGEFLALLREAGKHAYGVDLDADMVDQCRAEGLDAVQADVIAHLASRPAGSLGGVFAAQLVEHMLPDRLLSFLAESARVLRPGGVLLLETINPASLSALRNFFADLTHVWPLVPETLAFLVESAGFREVRIEPASPLPESQRLAHVPYGPSVPEAARAASNRNVELLNALLFGPQDYAVLARAPGDGGG
jgi:O-antigen chain-terminating methyltransferase